MLSYAKRCYSSIVIVHIVILNGEGWVGMELQTFPQSLLLDLTFTVFLKQTGASVLVYGV